MNVTNVLVKSSVINKPKKETIRGVNVTTMLSPFDVPQNVLCEFDDDSGTLTFKFTYLSDDKNKYSVDSDDNLVKLTLGKTSNRVYEIELRKTYMQESQPWISILERTHTELKHTHTKLKKSLTHHPNNTLRGFDAVESVLEKYEEKLIPRALAC